MIDLEKVKNHPDVKQALLADPSARQLLVLVVREDAETSKMPELCKQLIDCLQKAGFPKERVVVLWGIDALLVDFPDGEVK